MGITDFKPDLSMIDDLVIKAIKEDVDKLIYRVRVQVNFQLEI